MELLSKVEIGVSIFGNPYRWSDRDLELRCNDKHDLDLISADPVSQRETGSS